jgi:VWFA-related protein
MRFSDKCVCDVRSIRDMVANANCFRTRVGLFFLVVSACLLPVARPRGIDPVAKPAAEIDLVPLGYSGLSAAARESGGSNLSLDFVDAHHVLLTFNPKKLFKRLPDCPPTHADRLIHALVLEVPSGKVVKETDWYLHDSRRYVWPLGSGRFLLRKLNTLYEVDSKLAEKQVFNSSKDLLWVSVTPDGKQIIVETREEGTPSAEESKDKGRPKISFLDAESMVVQRIIEPHGTINLDATSSGFAEVHKQGNVWLVRFGVSNITRVKARRSPNILYTSGNTLLIGRCSLSSDGYSVSAFTITGHYLWRQHWNQCRYSPVARGSEDGGRFAVGTVTIRSGAASPPDTVGSVESQEEGLEQTIQVFDTASGNSVLSVNAAPAVVTGQNFSLSPDGRQLAVLAGTVLQIHSLPEMSAGERTQYLAVKSDIPSLHVPTPRKGTGGAAEEPVYTSAANEEAVEDEQPDHASSSTATPETKRLATGTSPIPANSAAANPTGSANAEAPALTIRTTTQVVALDVVVTDSKGHVVRGLQQGDFTVAEDGKPQTVRYFREFAGAQPAAPAQPPPKETLPPNIFSNHSQPAESGAVTVVLLDLLNTPLADQALAQAELVRFLKSKQKDSQFALCTLGNRLQMIQGFTPEGSVLLAAAKGKKGSARHRPLQDPDTVLPTTLEAATATAKILPALDFFVQSVELQQSEARLIDADQRMSVTVDAFAHLARYLSGIPGRKNLVWLSGSFLLGIYPDSSGQNPFIQARSYSDNLKRVANLLAEAHVAVYPVDVKGLETDPLFTAASNDTLAPISMQDSTPIGPAHGGVIPFAGANLSANTAVSITVMQQQAEQFGLSQMDEHATMDQLAVQTGGQAFYNTNGIAQAIHTATEQGANYYAFSYTPQNKKYDGAFRKVKVVLAGKKYHLAYRSGYYAVDPYAPAKPSKDLTSSLARAAMQQGSPQSRQIVFGARVVPVGKPRAVRGAPTTPRKPSKKRKDNESLVDMQQYAIDYAVTFGDLHFYPTPDGSYHDTLNFMVTAFNDDGGLTASQISQTVADLKPEVFRDIMLGGVRLHQEIDVPVKSVTMRLGIEDVANSHIGTLEIPLPVPAPPDAPETARRSLPPIEPD